MTARIPPITIPAIAPPDSICIEDAAWEVVVAGFVETAGLAVVDVVVEDVWEAMFGPPVSEGSVSPVGNLSPGTSIYEELRASCF